MDNLNLKKMRYLLTISVRDFIKDYSYKIDFESDYQRDLIWSREKQEALLDSIIENIDIPKLYLAEVVDKKEFDYECIDGKQRMYSILNFFKPDESEKKPLTVTIVSRKYSYKDLIKDHPNYAKQMEDYELHFLIYKKNFIESKTENFINKIFRRLQLGIRLNPGELLKSHVGVVRKFIFENISGKGPFFKNTGLSEKRYQKELAIAQICFNSFKRNIANYDNFERARTSDLEEFLDENQTLKIDNDNLIRIKNILNIMDSTFGIEAKHITGRAAAVSAYLFTENLYLNEKKKFVKDFALFYIKLLNEIKENMNYVRKFAAAKNTRIMDRFQKYILQASVESYSIKKRDDFLKEAFEHYLKTGKIIGDK